MLSEPSAGLHSQPRLSIVRIFDAAAAAVLRSGTACTRSATGGVARIPCSHFHTMPSRAARNPPVSAKLIFLKSPSLSLSLSRWRRSPGSC